MPKFRKKPVVIEAIQYDRDNPDAVRRFVTTEAVGDDGLGNLVILTLEGQHIASPGDWIIKGVAGEFYPCKPDIFEGTYEPVDE